MNSPFIVLNYFTCVPNPYLHVLCTISVYGTCWVFFKTSSACLFKR